MIRIAITEAAFEAIAATLPLGLVGFSNETNERSASTSASRSFLACACSPNEPSACPGRARA
jgi:hypothetical protein